MTQNIVVRLEKGDLVWFKELPIGLGTAGAKHFFWKFDSSLLGKSEIRKFTGAGARSLWGTALRYLGRSTQNGPCRTSHRTTATLQKDIVRHLKEVAGRPCIAPQVGIYVLLLYIRKTSLH